MNGGKRSSRLRSETDLWLRAAGGTLRQFQQRREMRRLNAAEADARRVAAERAAQRQAASRRKTVALLTGLVLAVTVPTWAIVSAVTAPSVHNGDASQLTEQAGASLELEPALQDPATLPVPTQTPEPTPTPDPEPEVAGVSKPAVEDEVKVPAKQPTRPAPKPENKPVTKPATKPSKAPNPPKDDEVTCADPASPAKHCGDDEPSEAPSTPATPPATAPVTPSPPAPSPPAEEVPEPNPSASASTPAGSGG